MTNQSTSANGTGRDGPSPSLLIAPAAEVPSWSAPEIEEPNRNALRSAIAKKQSAYGELETPLVLVLSAFDLYPFERELFDALIGDEVPWINVETRENGTSRRTNGVWFDTAGWKGQHLSAVLYTPGLGPRSITSSSWTLIHHPCPLDPLPTGLFPFAREVTWDEDGAALSADPTLTVEECMGLPPT